jgi:hypothetical protein
VSVDPRLSLLKGSPQRLSISISEVQADFSTETGLLGSRMALDGRTVGG